MIKIFGKAKTIKVVETFKSFEKTTVYEGNKIISVDRVFFQKKKDDDSRMKHDGPINEDERKRILLLAKVHPEKLKKYLTRKKAINSAERYMRFQNYVGLIGLEMGRNFYEVRKIIKKEYPNYFMKFQSFHGRPRKESKEVLSMKKFIFKILDSSKDKKAFMAAIPGVDVIDFLRFWDSNPEKLIFSYLQKIGKKVTRHEFYAYVEEYKNK